MKVFNLQCAAQHGFEGWFASEDDFQQQLARQLVSCPLCSSTVITKLPSAPRLNLGAKAPGPANRAEADASARQAANPNAQPSHQSPATEQAQALQAAWMHTVRHLIANTEDVGPRFAEEARRMHYGEAAERGIRGQTSADEREALREEGIDVMQLPLPDFAKEPLQ